jgi:hypothetical protein
VPNSAYVEVWLLFFGLAAAALICFFWEYIAPFVTENGEGEPLFILEGISVWPTILLRLFGAALSSYFIWRTLRSLHENLLEITKSMDLDPEPKKWTPIKNGFKPGLFDFSLGGNLGSGLID